MASLSDHKDREDEELKEKSDDNIEKLVQDMVIDEIKIEVKANNNEPVNQGEGSSKSKADDGSNKSKSISPATSEATGTPNFTMPN